MPYHLAGSEVRASELLEPLRYCNWWTARNLMGCLNEMRKINFSVIEQRNQALERFSALPVVDPLEAGRFPLGRDYYVCELLGDWPRKCQQLRMTLTSRELPSSRRDDQQSTAAYNDAFVAFWNATTSMLDELRRLDGVWSRRTFESFFSLEWQEDEPANDDQ
jgi:hypothetical protein